LCSKSHSCISQHAGRVGVEGVAAVEHVLDEQVEDDGVGVRECDAVVVGCGCGVLTVAYVAEDGGEVRDEGSRKVPYLSDAFVEDVSCQCVTRVVRTLTLCTVETSLTDDDLDALTSETACVRRAVVWKDWILYSCMQKRSAVP